MSKRIEPNDTWSGGFEGAQGAVPHHDLCRGQRGVQHEEEGGWRARRRSPGRGVAGQAVLQGGVHWVQLRRHRLRPDALIAGWEPVPLAAAFGPITVLSVQVFMNDDQQLFRCVCQILCRLHGVCTRAVLVVWISVSRTLIQLV